MAIPRRLFLAGVGPAAALGAEYLFSGRAAAQQNLAPATLTMWANHPEWVRQLAALVAEFEQQNPSVHIELTEKPGPTYPTLVTSALAADSAPDIFGMNAGLTYLQIAKAG